MQQRMRKTGVREEMETVSKRKGVEFLHKQKKELLETIEQLQGEGNDLYDSIEMSMREKEDLMKQGGYEIIDTNPDRLRGGSGDLQAGDRFLGEGARPDEEGD